MSLTPKFINSVSVFLTTTTSELLYSFSTDRKSVYQNDCCQHCRLHFKSIYVCVSVCVCVLRPVARIQAKPNKPVNEWWFVLPRCRRSRTQQLSNQIKTFHPVVFVSLLLSISSLRTKKGASCKQDLLVTTRLDMPKSKVFPISNCRPWQHKTHRLDERISFCFSI